MRTSIATLAVVAALACACGAEGGNEGVQSAHQTGKGTSATYDASFDEVWRATHVALQWNDAGAPQDHLQQAGESSVISNPDSHKPSYDSQVGVWIDPMNTRKQRVSVVVVNLTGAQEIGGPNEKGVQKDIATVLAMLQSGKTPPDKRP